MIKGFENFNIDVFCKTCGITDFTVNKDNSIDVNGDVFLYLGMGNLQKIPFKFNEVNGSFSVSSLKNLISLENSPEYVSDYYDCSYNSKLISLNGCSKIVGSFICVDNISIHSLNECPSEIGNFLNIRESGIRDFGKIPFKFHTMLCETTFVFPIYNLSVRNKSEFIENIIEYDVIRMSNNSMSGRKIIKSRLIKAFEDSGGIGEINANMFPAYEVV